MLLFTKQIWPPMSHCGQLVSSESTGSRCFSKMDDDKQKSGESNVWLAGPRQWAMQGLSHYEQRADDKPINRSMQHGWGQGLFPSIWWKRMVTFLYASGHFGKLPIIAFCAIKSNITRYGCQTHLAYFSERVSGMTIIDSNTSLSCVIWK